jgi:hypothetical protein
MSMRYPNIVYVDGVIRGAKETSFGLPDGRYVPARALGFQSWRYRWKAAWLVWSGRADALLWEGQ